MLAEAGPGKKQVQKTKKKKANSLFVAPGQNKFVTPLKLLYQEDPQSKEYKDFKLNIGFQNRYHSKTFGQTVGVGTSLTVPLLKQIDWDDQFFGLQDIGQDVSTENVKMSVDFKLFF